MSKKDKKIYEKVTGEKLPDNVEVKAIGIKAAGCFHCVIMELGNDMVQKGAIDSFEFHRGILNAAVDSFFRFSQENGCTARENLDDFIKALKTAVQERENDITTTKAASVSLARH